MNDIDQRYNDLKSLIGSRAYNYLRRGGFLRIWRCSSPHNIWIETKKGDYLWHSESDRSIRKVPDLSLFEEVYSSDKRVVKYFGSDSGIPEGSLYVLKSSL